MLTESTLDLPQDRRYVETACNRPHELSNVSLQARNSICAVKDYRRHARGSGSHFERKELSIRCTRERSTRVLCSSPCLLDNNWSWCRNQSDCRTVRIQPRETVTPAATLWWDHIAAEKSRSKRGRQSQDQTARAALYGSFARTYVNGSGFVNIGFKTGLAALQGYVKAIRGFGHYSE